MAIAQELRAPCLYVRGAIRVDTIARPWVVHLEQLVVAPAAANRALVACFPKASLALQRAIDALEVDMHPAAGIR
jgi:hypothetical protein